MATPKQPRKTTRSKKATSVAAETEVPLATGGDGERMDASSAVGIGDLRTHHTESHDDRVRRRAYELYVARGGAGGSEMDDWLEAERQLRVRHEQSATSALQATTP